MVALNYVLQYLHIVFAAFWIGSLLYTEIVLWPSLRSIGQLATVQPELRKVGVRVVVGIFNIGTIVTGLARGVANGVLDRLYTPYGALFITGAAIGIWMITWWISFPSREMKLGWRIFYSSFWVILAVMIGMRFTT